VPTRGKPGGEARSEVGHAPQVGAVGLDEDRLEALLAGIQIGTLFSGPDVGIPLPRAGATAMQSLAVNKVRCHSPASGFLVVRFFTDRIAPNWASLGGLWHRPPSRMIIFPANFGWFHRQIFSAGQSPVAAPLGHRYVRPGPGQPPDPSLIGTSRA
jgi:hypothetical protein